jgi:hypothetical protein
LITPVLDIRNEGGSGNGFCDGIDDGDSVIFTVLLTAGGVDRSGVSEEGVVVTVRMMIV